MSTSRRCGCLVTSCTTCSAQWYSISASCHMSELLCTLWFSVKTRHNVADYRFLGDRCKHGLLYAMGPLSCLSVCLSVLCCLSIMLVWPNGWMDKGETWHGGRPQPRPHCVRRGTHLPPPQKKGHSPQFLAHVHCGQTTGWIKMPLGMEVDPSLGHIVLDPAPQKRAQQPPNFQPMNVVTKRLDGSSATEYGGRPRPRRHCVRWWPISSQRGTASSPNFWPIVCCGQMAGWIKIPLGTEVDVSPRQIVLDGVPASLPETVAHLSYNWALVFHV